MPTGFLHVTRVSIAIIVAAWLSGTTLALTSAGTERSADSVRLIAYWHFNEFDLDAETIKADAGDATLSLENWKGNVARFRGTTRNAMDETEAGDALALQAGSNLEGNGSFIELSFSMTGRRNLLISFAARGTGTGFDSGAWSWSIDGETFTEVQEVNTATRDALFAIKQIDLGNTSELNDAARVQLRYTLDGAESAAGNNRLDNLRIEADIIDEPEEEVVDDEGEENPIMQDGDSAAESLP